MSGNIFKFLVSVILILCSIVGLAQQKFIVTVNFPKGLIANKIEISYYTGIKEKKIKPRINKKSITISDSFYSKYASLIILIDSNNYYLPAYNSFYVSKRPANIVFNPQRNSSKKEYPKYKLRNAYDVSSISNKFRNYIASEEKELNDYANSHEIDSIYFSLFRKLISKKLKFIQKNKKFYYSFQIFKKEISPITFGKKDSLLDALLDFYTVTFPQDFKETIEGNQITNILQSRKVATHDNIKAPDFTTTDILGHNFSLQSQRGKYVLINLWATWCIPCVAELPAIKQIRNKYPGDSLAIVSVSYDRDTLPFLQALQKHKMDWINVYRDEELGDKYGGRIFLPGLFLIDKDGVIIYNRNSGKETDFEKLSVLNSILEKRIRDNLSGQ